MTRSISVIACGITALFLTACPGSGARVPVPTPSYPGAAADTALTTLSRKLSFTPGHFKYLLTQNTKVEGDTSESTVLTTAYLSADVSADENSAYGILISVDSFHIVTESPIPTHPIMQSRSLGPILHASMSEVGTQLENRLADSLCAYSQFITAARELLVPQLPHEFTTPLLETLTDSTRITACRAGTRIDMLLTRQLRDLRRQPLQLALQGRTELGGSGLLGRDSVTVSGVMSTDGTISFTGLSRLPSHVETRSEGSITVRLGSSTTKFRQRSTLQIREDQTARPP